MRTIIIFLLTLFSLLLKGGIESYAGGGHHTKGCYVSAKRIDKPEHQQPEGLIKNFPLVKHNHLSEKKDDFISIENEEESEDFNYSRKQIIPVKYTLELYSSAILFLLQDTTKNRLPLCRYLSYTSSPKYILQRVLRI